MRAKSFKAGRCSVGFALAFFCCVVDDARTQPYLFTAMAGSANVGTADGTNTDAGFNQPAGIVYDNAGTFYVADMYNNAIRKVVRAGSNYVVTTIAGVAGSPPARVDGTNSHAQFYGPQGMALDSAGNLFVADSYNNVIRKIAPSGTNWVTSTLTPAMSFPTAVALDPGGNIYITALADNTIRKLHRSGSSWILSLIAGLANNTGSADGTNTAARFNAPNGITLDAQTNLYVTDLSNNTIRQITPVGPDWVVTTIAGFASPVGGIVDGTNSGARFSAPLGITLDASNNLYVSQYTCLRKLTRSGTNWIVTTLTGASPAFFEPNALLIGPDATIYVTDTMQNYLRIAEPRFLLNSTGIDSQLLLSWPPEAHKYVLETSPTLNHPSWVSVTNGIVNSPAGFAFTNDTSSPSAFFRLRRQ